MTVASTTGENTSSQPKPEVVPEPRSHSRYSKAPLYLRVGLQLQGLAGHEVESEPEGEGELRGKRRVEELEDTALNSRHASEGCEHENGAEKVGDGEEASSERGKLKWRNLGEKERRRSQRLEIRALGATRQTLVMSDAEFIARDLHALYFLHGEMDACNEPEALNNKITLAEIPDCAVGDIGRDIEIGGIVRSLRERGSAGSKKDHDSHLYRQADRDTKKNSNPAAPTANEWPSRRPQDPGWAGEALITPQQPTSVQPPRVQLPPQRKSTVFTDPTDYLSGLPPTITTFNVTEIVVPPSVVVKALGRAILFDPEIKQ
ncbi:hypothetical protein DFH09DRAFT_1281202 [Mycena vulgaris]|nr:hypothetical protein DFH09DRAFT_1281202 [Mycena vulgaris]